MQFPANQLRPSTLILSIAIAVLSCALVVEHRKDARLRAALVDYKIWSHDLILRRLKGPARKLNWPVGCRLEDVVKQIQLATAATAGWAFFPSGAPVTVDPLGLERAGHSLNSPVPSPPADPDLTLGEKLDAVLGPLGLGYDVRDATVVITARELIPAPPIARDDEH